MLHPFDGLHLGDNTLDGALDALFEGLHGMGAGAAVALQAHHDDAFDALAQNTINAINNLK